MTLPTDAMAALFQAQPANDMPDVPNFNVCPTNQVHVVTGGDARRLASMRWGFIPQWYSTPTDGPLLINARSETIAQKPAFRDACRTRRCIIPANGFYEWTKDETGARLPWYIHNAGTLAFAGVYQAWGPDGIATCAVVTCAANPVMSQIHRRMPVILAQEDWATWLGETEQKAAPLMVAAAEDALQFHRVDPKVNSNRAFGPDLVNPVSPAHDDGSDDPA